MQALDRAATVLRAFSAEQPEWGVRALAVFLQWPRSTLQAYLSGLSQAGLLRRTAEGHYRLSWHIAELAAPLTDALPWFGRARARLSHLAQLCRALGFLCVLEEDRVLCITRSLGDPADPAAIQTDVVLPANATAAGKVLYAFAPAPLPTFERFTTSTIVTPDEWQGELAQVRAQGHAHAIEEWIAGHCSLSVPLWWEGAVVAAFGLQLPTARFLPQEARLLRRLLEAPAPFQTEPAEPL